MSELAIGFGAIADDLSDDDQWVPKTETVIECTECGDKLYYKDFGPNNSAFSCECRNVRIGSAPAWCAPYSSFMTVTYKIKPKIYEIGYEEYCEVKEKRNHNDAV
tara:strand:- start:293 stop:607 length:315 start_codon:yes stop_codon:yes gene_type:complete